MTRAYIPEPFTATDSETFGNSIANHLETLDVNSKKAGPGLGRFDRYVRADWAISPEHEAEYARVSARAVCPWGGISRAVRVKIS